MDVQQAPAAIIGPITAGFQQIITRVPGVASGSVFLCGPNPARWAIIFILDSGGTARIVPDGITQSVSGYPLTAADLVLEKLWKDFPTLVTGGWRSFHGPTTNVNVIDIFRIGG